MTGTVNFVGDASGTDPTLGPYTFHESIVGSVSPGKVVGSATVSFQAMGVMNVSSPVSLVGTSSTGHFVLNIGELFPVVDPCAYQLGASPSGPATSTANNTTSLVDMDIGFGSPLITARLPAVGSVLSGSVKEVDLLLLCLQRTPPGPGICTLSGPTLVVTWTITWNLAINALASNLTITTQQLPNGTVGSAYPSTTLTATGGTPPYTWSVSGLPTGLAADPKTGVISGTPTAGGNLTVNVQVTDSAGATASKSLGLVIVNSTATIKIDLSSPMIEPFNKSPVKGQPPPPASLVKVTVSVLDSSRNPVSNYSVNVAVVAADLKVSAGHDHTNTDSVPTGMLSDSPGHVVTQCHTGAAGEPCEVFYAPDVVSGVFAITATSATDSTVSTSMPISVIVSGLQSLQAQNSVYRLTGAISGRHTVNHYSGTYLGHVVPLIAGIYNTIETQFGFSTPTLGINDLSLPWGGLFDLDALWDNASGHNLHRDGRSVDIDHTDGSNSPTDEPFLDLIAGSFGLYRIPEGPKSIHYQSPF